MIARDQAIELMRQQRYAEALTEFRHLISDAPSDWELLYMAGQCCRFLNDLDEAVSYLQRAAAINTREPPILLALGVAQQLNGEFEGAIGVLVQAIQIDPDYELAYNSLALTQKKTGQLEKAMHNYDAGAKALARRIVKGMTNSRSNTILGFGHSRHNIWREYAGFGALYLAAITEGIESIAWLTASQAIEEERTGQHEGLYWVDHQTSEGKNVRLCTVT